MTICRYGGATECAAFVLIQAVTRAVPSAVLRAGRPLQVSIATVVAAEQVAAFVSTSQDGIRARDAADFFLKLLVQDPDAATSSGTALGRLRDPSWLQGAIVAIPAAVRGGSIEADAPEDDTAAVRFSDDLTPENLGGGDDNGVAASKQDPSTAEGEDEDTAPGRSSGAETTPAPVARMEERRRRGQRRLTDTVDGGGDGDGAAAGNGDGTEVEVGAGVPVDGNTEDPGEDGDATAVVGSGVGDDAVSGEEDGAGGTDDGAGDDTAGDDNSGAASAEAGDAAVAVAATVALVTDAVMATHAGKGAGDLEGVLQQWAGLAHVAEGDFVVAARQVGLGEIDATNYGCEQCHACTSCVIFS